MAQAVARTGRRDRLRPGADLHDLRARMARTTLATELPATPSSGPQQADDLLTALEGPPPLPADDDLAALLGGGLRRGAVYRLTGSTSLLFRLLSRPTQEGLWCGLVGLPDLGYEAAAAAGVELDRLVVVPRPERQWLSVVSTLADALPIVVLQPPTGSASGPPPAVAARIAARARHHGSTLLVAGESPKVSWSQTFATIAAETQRWHGLGSGHGYLTEHELTVTVADRSGVHRTGVIGRAGDRGSRS